MLPIHYNSVSVYGVRLQVENALLFYLSDILHDNGRNLRTFCLPEPTSSRAEVFRALTETGSTELQSEQLAYNHEESAEQATINSALLNEEQRHAFDAFCTAIDSTITTTIPNRGEVITSDPTIPSTYLWQAPGGTGKTFTAKSCIDYARGQNKVVLCVASSGLAATLLQGGRTAHSLLRIPIEIEEHSTCNIPTNSQRAELIRRAHAILWDEALSSHRFNFQAVDRTLRDICGMPDTPFGGKIFIAMGKSYTTILNRFNRILPLSHNLPLSNILPLSRNLPLSLVYSHAHRTKPNGYYCGHI